MMMNVVGWVLGVIEEVIQIKIPISQIQNVCFPNYPKYTRTFVRCQEVRARLF